MKKTRPSLDGFVPRQATRELGRQHTAPQPQRVQRAVRPVSDVERRRKQLHTGEDTLRDMAKKPQQTSVGTSSIRESLQAIDNDPDDQPLTRRERRRIRKERHKSSKKRRIIKRVLLVLGIIILAVGGYLGYKALSNLDSVFQGGLFGLTQKKPLKQDSNGRSNILIFGTSEDSPDHNDGGAGPLLTDSIMVLSVHQERKEAYMVSIPRDLWVKFDEPCSVGYQEKINSVYQCGSDFGEDQAAGAAALQKKVGEVLGLDIQYYAQVDFSVVTKAVDAVGGVEVTIESNPKGMGILDRNFDWKCGYRCHYVKYDDGQVAQLDGEHALALSRARNAQGGYGLAAGNFDREKNQQKIIKALREKALSVGTLTNLSKVTGLLDALGDNLKTSIDKSEVQTIMMLASEIQTEAIQSLSLVEEEAPLVTTGPVGAASAVYPVAGLFDYSAIQSYIARVGSSNPAAREGAQIVVLNGTSTQGVARTEADKLESDGYTITTIDDAPAGTYAPAEVYQIGEGNTATAAALAKRYNVTIKTTPPPISVGSSISFVVIIGTAPAS